MKNYFENKLNYNQISFCLTNKTKIDEREIHSYHEILLYLEGDVELFTINGRHALKKPSLLIIPAENFHFLKSKNSLGFTRLKISFPAGAFENTPLVEIMSEFKVVDVFSEEQKLIFNKLGEVLRESSKNAGFYAYSFFLTLVSEFDMHHKNNAKENHSIKTGPMNLIAEYISSNLSKSLDIKTLAEQVHISPSGITHRFKKEFGIPIHKYIMQKRLIYAKRLAENGEQLNKIYSDVGFKDYSSFYKAYTRYFGCSPSCDKGKNI